MKRCSFAFTYYFPPDVLLQGSAYEKPHLQPTKQRSTSTQSIQFQFHVVEEIDIRTELWLWSWTFAGWMRLLICAPLVPLLMYCWLWIRVQRIRTKLKCWMQVPFSTTASFSCVLFLSLDINYRFIAENGRIDLISHTKAHAVPQIVHSILLDIVSKHILKRINGHVGLNLIS